MQKASEIFPLADREGAIDIIGLFMFASVIALCFKCLEKSILFCSWSEEDVGRNILHFLRQVSHYSSQKAETIWASHRFKTRKKLENLLRIQKLTTASRYPGWRKTVCRGHWRAWDIPQWDSRNVHCSKSALYLGEGLSPTFGRQCTQMERYSQETTASATYMVVGRLDRFWCHQSHFHPYPHTSNIHCQHGTVWVGNSHAHHTGEWSDQLLHPLGRKHCHCQELLPVHAGIWSFLLLGKKTREQNKPHWIFIF